MLRLGIAVVGLVCSLGLAGCSVNQGQRSGESVLAATEDIVVKPVVQPLPPEAPSAGAIATPAAEVFLAREATTADADLFSPQAQSDHSGSFRVGNQTEHPLRIALLPRQVNGQKDGAGSKDLQATARYDIEPIHWDFAPGEGGQAGLVLSLPQGDLQLEAGDVLVAFAQDGSRRYWGPYVVGQTQLPYWNLDRQEWQLLIQP